jgi:hypothetical protein
MPSVCIYIVSSYDPKCVYLLVTQNYALTCEAITPLMYMCDSELCLVYPDLWTIMRLASASYVTCAFVTQNYALRIPIVS